MGLTNLFENLKESTKINEKKKKKSTKKAENNFKCENIKPVIKKNNKRGQKREKKREKKFNDPIDEIINSNKINKKCNKNEKGFLPKKLSRKYKFNYCYKKSPELKCFKDNNKQYINQQKIDNINKKIENIFNNSEVDIIEKDTIKHRLYQTMNYKSNVYSFMYIIFILCFIMFFYILYSFYKIKY
tara:strand:- start:290 stop:847 length:558 start_codon:yes stop_codon:yes gene_type:complete